VALPAACRAAARLLPPPAVQQSIDISWPPGPQQQTRRSDVLLPDGTDRQADGRLTVA